MTDEPINLVLEHLKRIQSNQSDHGRLLQDVVDRLSHVEKSLLGIRRDFTNETENSLRLENRIDRIRSDVDRIMRRLDLVDA